jgi:hypothetical protein
VILTVNSITQSLIPSSRGLKLFYKLVGGEGAVLCRVVFRGSATGTPAIMVKGIREQLMEHFEQAGVVSVRCFGNPRIMVMLIKTSFTILRQVQTFYAN